MTLCVEIKILLDWGCPSLAATCAANPHVAVDHAMTDNRPLLGISTLVEHSKISGMSHAALTVRAHRLA